MLHGYLLSQFLECVKNLLSPAVSTDFKFDVLVAIGRRIWFCRLEIFKSQVAAVKRLGRWKRGGIESQNSQSE